MIGLDREFPSRDELMEVLYSFNHGQGFSLNVGIVFLGWRKHTTAQPNDLFLKPIMGEYEPNALLRSVTSEIQRLP